MSRQEDIDARIDALTSFGEYNALAEEYGITLDPNRPRHELKAILREVLTKNAEDDNATAKASESKTEPTPPPKKKSGRPKNVSLEHLSNATFTFGKVSLKGKQVLTLPEPEAMAILKRHPTRFRLVE